MAHDSIWPCGDDMMSALGLDADGAGEKRFSTSAQEEKAISNHNAKQGMIFHAC